MTDYKPTPHLPDDEGRRLLSELWALYGETVFNSETGKPLKMPRADTDFWKMRQATTRLRQAIIRGEANAEGMTIRDYAAKIGMNEHSLHDRVSAAKVVRHVSNAWSTAFDGTPEAQIEALVGLYGPFGIDHFRHFAEIHAAPGWLWPALMAAAHPDRGGSSAAFVEARQRYVAARRACRSHA